MFVRRFELIQIVLHAHCETPVVNLSINLDSGITLQVKTMESLESRGRNAIDNYNFDYRTRIHPLNSEPRDRR